MAYAAQSDMVSRFGQTEVLALTDRERSGEIDADVLARALDDASAEIDTYLAGRYPLPFVTVPKFVVGLTCDVAAYRLCVGEVRLTDEIKERYRSAVRFLELAAAGKVTLGELPNGEPVKSSLTVAVQSDAAIWRDGDAGAY